MNAARSYAAGRIHFIICCSFCLSSMLDCSFMNKFLIIFLLTFPVFVMAQQKDSVQIIEGKLTISQLEEFKWFKNNYASYKPAMSVVDELATFKKCSLLVILGTWCSDSHELVPQLYKVIDLAGWPQPELIGVDRKKQCSTIDIKPLHIEYVPVIVVFEKGKELGRIVETTKNSIEEDLLEILQKSKQQ
jgi:hypothetical protein